MSPPRSGLSIARFFSGSGAASITALVIAGLAGSAGATAASSGFRKIDVLVPTVEAGGKAPESGLREPCLSPDGTRIVFVYAGDLWLTTPAGEAVERMTFDPADERLPVWAPDGQSLAFASKRAGNYDVFLLTLADRSTRRLTFDEADEEPSGFLPDASGILFETESSRGARASRVVPVDGGEPFRFPRSPGRRVVASPSGLRLAGVRGLTPWWRLDYRGPAATRIEVADATREHRFRISDGEFCELFPQWGRSDRFLFYVSDESPARNIWVADLRHRRRWQLTGHTDGPVFHLSVSREGSRMVWEQSGWLWTAALPGPAELDPSSSIEVSRIPVRFSVAIGARSAGRSVRVDRGLEEVTVAGTGTQATAVAAAFGELYALPAWPADGSAAASADSAELLRDLAGHPFRDRDPDLSPDGTRLVFSSDRSGNHDLYVLESADIEESQVARARRHRLEVFRDDHREERMPKFSPDGRFIAYVRRDDEAETLRLADARGGRETALAKGRRFESFRFSPDGRWIAYARSDELGQFDVYVVSLFEAGEHNVSAHPARDVSPVWSPDGRWLVFVSDRAGSDDLWVSSLRNENPLGFFDLDPPGVAGRPGPGRPSLGSAGEASREVVVDVAGLSDRTAQITHLYGDERIPEFLPGSSGLVFRSDVVKGADVWRLARGASSPERLTEGGWDPRALVPNANGSVTVLRGDGRVSWLGEAGVRDLRYAIQPPPESPGERAQMLGEVWRILRDGFYDRHLHLVRWDDRYHAMESRLESVTTREGLSDLIRRMLGGLNASHVGDRLPPSPASVETGRLGFQPLRLVPSLHGLGSAAETAEDGVALGSLVPGGPLARTGVVRRGDRILDVEGRLVGRDRSLAEALAGSVGREIEITVRRSDRRAGGDADRETLRLVPESSERIRERIYRDWVERKLDQARILSADRCAYVHLPAVDRASADLLERELFLQRGKDGLVLDLRGNPGGAEFERLLALFSMTPAVQRQGRGQIRIAVPSGGWTGPMVVLVDAGTGSAAELLVLAIQRAGGIVVGPGTHGGVIGTEDVELIDGSILRLPHTGWYTLDGLNLENRGVSPDVKVETSMDDAPEHDPILSEGVRVLLERIEGAGTSGRRR